jgi:hypothetical protein
MDEYKDCFTPFFSTKSQNGTNTGFPHRKAMIATTNKLIRALYALLIRG